MENARKEVEDAKAKVVAAEMTLTSEVRTLQDGEQRHTSLFAEASRASEEPPTTMHVDFAAELAQLRSLVAELQREREELRSELGAARCCHTTRGGSPTQVNSVVVNTSIPFDGATQPTGHQWREGSEPVTGRGCMKCAFGQRLGFPAKTFPQGCCACVRAPVEVGGFPNAEYMSLHARWLHVCTHANTEGSKSETHMSVLTST